MRKQNKRAASSEYPDLPRSKMKKLPENGAADGT